MKIKEILEKTQNGDVQAMIELGRYIFYHNNDFENGLMWLEKALEQGCNDAILEIAKLYEQRDILKSKQIDGVILDIEYSIETIEWYQKALNFYENHYQEKTEYAFNAGELFSDVDVIGIDYEKAFSYFLYLANLQDEEDVLVKIARMQVAKMYRIGLGCNQDLDKSRYYRSISGYDEHCVRHNVFKSYFNN